MEFLSLRALALGGLLPAAALCVLAGATARFWPDGALVGTFGRMLDSLAPQLFVLSLLLCAALALLGLPRVALGLALLSALGQGALLMDLRGLARPLAAAEAEAPFTAIWFNLYEQNATPPERLAEAILDSGADLVALGEADPIRPVLPLLEETYPYRIGCEGRRCGVLLLSRHPFAPGTQELANISRRERLVRARVEPEGRAPLEVLVEHMAKPWFYGFIEEDRWYLLDRLALIREASGPEAPVLVMGDFNAAPWSRPVAALLREADLAPARRPVPTWPAAAGPLGVPIDQMLVGGRARLTALAPWGGDLGSNHRGLAASVTWPEPG